MDKKLEDSTAAISDEVRVDRRRDLEALIEMMRPAVQSDGGDLVLVSADVESGVVEVMLQGSCSSCAISATTLKAGVERILKGRLSWVTEVKGDLDESVDLEESISMGRGGYVPKY
jgi:Fe-S cluster biogenesis protein NfuA